MLFIYTVTLLTSRKSSLHVQTNYLNTEKDELPPSTKSIQSKSSKYTSESNYFLFQILRAFKAPSPYPCQDHIPLTHPLQSSKTNASIFVKNHINSDSNLSFSPFCCHLLISLSNNEESMIKALLMLINTSCRSLNQRVLRLTKI